MRLASVGRVIPGELQLFPERNRRSPGVENAGGVLAASANAGGPARTAMAPDQSIRGDEVTLLRNGTGLPGNTPDGVLPEGPMLRKASACRSTDSWASA